MYHKNGYKTNREKKLYILRFVSFNLIYFYLKGKKRNK